MTQTAKRYLLTAPILNNQSIWPGFHKITIHAEEISSSVKPGQYLLIHHPVTHSRLLPTALFVKKNKDEELELWWFETYLKAPPIMGSSGHEYLEISGPHGNPYGIMEDRPAILIYEKYGSVPLASLAEELAIAGVSRIHAISHWPQEDDLVWGRAFEKCQLSAHSHRMEFGDPSRNEAATIAMLNEAISNLESETDVKPAIYLCGSERMIRWYLKLIPLEIPVQVGFTDCQITCGIGTCVACGVESKGGYKRVCMEGPVFDGNEFR